MSSAACPAPRLARCSRELRPHIGAMRDISYVIGLVSALVLLAAAFAWLKIQRNPRDDLTVGQGGKPNSKRLTTASLLISMALGFSGVAAAVAVVAWFHGLLNA